jgi:hypothetical protein
MIRKKIVLISLIFFLSNCGFTPVYLKNTNVNFSIEKVNYTGDRDLNNFIKTDLDQYKNEKKDNKIIIEVNSSYNKIILTKDSTGKITNYQLEAKVVFLIKSNNQRFTFTEKKIMPSIDDKFEEASYERSVKQGFASSMSSKLISKIIINQ